MVCPDRQGRVESCEHFVDKKGRVHFFSILCGRLIWTAPYRTCAIHLHILLTKVLYYNILLGVGFTNKNTLKMYIYTPLERNLNDFKLCSVYHISGGQSCKILIYSILFCNEAGMHYLTIHSLQS